MPNFFAALYKERQGRHGDVKEFPFFSHSRRRNPKDPCCKERCWAEFSINEATRVCSRHFGEEDLQRSLKGNFSRPRTGGIPSIFAWKRSSLCKGAPPTPRFKPGKDLLRAELKDKLSAALANN